MHGSEKGNEKEMWRRGWKTGCRDECQGGGLCLLHCVHSEDVTWCHGTSSAVVGGGDWVLVSVGAFCFVVHNESNQAEYSNAKQRLKMVFDTAFKWQLERTFIQNKKVLMALCRYCYSTSSSGAGGLHSCFIRLAIMMRSSQSIEAPIRHRQRQRSPSLDW